MLSCSLRYLAALLSLAPIAGAQGRLWTVGPPNSADFDSIQLAVEAAADGDFIFVEAGSYPSFVVDGKALTVVASPQAPVDCGTIRVRNIAAGEACVFRGLRATGLNTSGFQTRGAFVSDCEGAVWFEDCALRSNDFPENADPALDVVDCRQVAVAGGTLTGGAGDWVGGNGIQASNSRLALYGVEVQGGQYGLDCTGADGGDGALLLAGSFLFASGGFLHGGDGTDTSCSGGCGGNGGNGITIMDGSTVELSDVSVDGGWRGLETGDCLSCCDGEWGSNVIGGSPIQFGQPTRALVTPRLQRGGELSPLQFLGVPGDAAFLLVSPRTDFMPISSWNGVSLLHKPDPPASWGGTGAGLFGGAHVRTSFLGIVPASGVLTVPISALEPVDEAAGDFVQAYAVSSTSDLVIGQPSRLVVIRSDLAVPDCNGNGIADADDIAGGTSPDCNSNGVPDECETFTDCNGNGVDDLCDIDGGTSLDCNFDAIPDECQADCNGNGVPDDCDISNGTSPDCNENGSPDECESGPDCNTNGVPDECDIASGISLDLNGDGIPDECQSLPPIRLFVDQDAPEGGDGLSWMTAYRRLQDALADPTMTLSREIWIAEGRYAPAAAGSNVHTGFVLQYGDALYGGFAGTEVDIAERDPLAHPTVLSGDIDHDDLPGFVNRSDNSYHVVVASGGVSFAIDGFVVRGGSSPSGTSGGGLVAVDCDVVRIANCRFEDNLAREGGGAHLSCDSLYLASCSFVGNRAWDYTGGGLNVITRSSAEIVNCEFIGNSSKFAGAGIHLRESENAGRIDSCTFFRNVSDFSEAAGLFTWGETPVPVENCIFWGNLGWRGSTEEQQLDKGSALGQFDVSHSCIQGLDLHQGAGNIGFDPRFVDRVGSDGVPGTADDDLRLTEDSPCVDAGRNDQLPADTADLDRDGDLTEALPLDRRLLPRRVDEPDVPDTGTGGAPLVDMGAHEREAP